MFKFSTQTKELLYKAGWHEGRSINTDLFEKSLSEDNYVFFSAVEAFLKEFGDLRISFFRIDTIDTFHFDARLAAEGVDSHWEQDNYACRLGKRLCVIGQGFSNHATLMMGEKGEVYGGFDDTLFFIANSGVEAIEAIISNQKCDQIP